MGTTPSTYNEREISEYWRLCDEPTIQQATLLMIGYDPASEEADCEQWLIHARPAGYEAVKQALSSALRKGSIEGRHVPLFRDYVTGHPLQEMPDTTDIEQSTIARDSLVEWLRSRGVNTGFFFPVQASDSSEPAYLNPRHPRYSGKLAAAVSAWLSVTETGGKSPKQALEKWLREHSAGYGMTDESGNPVKQAVEDCAKVANWEQSGGAPRTPAKGNPSNQLS